MKVLGLDGREHPWSLKGYIPSNDDTRPRSQYHLAVRQLLRQMFFACPILEEVPLPGSGGMRVDFYIPQQKLAVEVQGEQHFKYIPHFHGNRVNFAAAKRRDNDKARWFALNGIRLVAVSHAETPNEWQRRIAGQEDG